MLLHLDFNSETPIYQQIRNQVVVGVAEGRLAPGERLPTIRALAEDCGVTEAELRTRFGKRVAMNAPIQGTAADIIKLAMIRVEEELKPYGEDAVLILQVHDELIVDCAAHVKDEVAEKLSAVMGSVVELAVPLIAEVGFGENWLDAK